MLEIRNLSKTYLTGKQAINDITLSIPTGMFGLLGPNGAGKSTLMRILATLQEATSGNVMLNDLDVLNQKNEIKKILGYLPQEFGFNKKDTAVELLDHFAILKGVWESNKRKTLVEALLKKVNLWEERRQKLGNFSGGMKQRMGIALVMLGDPKLIIVDEPTAGLDPDERNRFHNLLSELGEGVVVILSTHIVEDVSDLCTNMAVIHKGSIILKEQPQQSIAKLNGKIWIKEIERDQMAEYEDRYKVLSSQLFGGKTTIHVHAETNPGNGFLASKPSLKDVYFLALKSSNK